MGDAIRLYGRGNRSPPDKPRLADLKGQRPRGHPVVKYTPHGRVIIALGQVWVVMHSSELWMVRRIVTQQTGKRRIFLSRYQHRSITLEYAEASFRTHLAVWEEAVKHLRELMSKVHQDIEAGAGKAWGITPSNVDYVLRNFFGVDPVTGERID